MLAGLALLAIPLRKITSAVVPRPVVPASSSSSSREMPAVLRLRLLAPAQRISCHTPDGKVLLDLQNVAAGESEHDALIPNHSAGMDVILRADFGATVGETAVFLTVMPDGDEDQTRFAIGSGLIEESLRYDWHVH
ncbi:MAG: hypothetical protein RLZZ282_1280 [Verrucomicrobiota bacterium]